MTSIPKVSIVTITYNQEGFIRETLESFIKQITDFKYEVVIADDCSTDNTPQIIKEYAEKYSEIFKPILRKKNIGVVPNLIGALNQADGEYVALCEGDDYWTDPLKLQKQADEMDRHQEWALCFHPVRVVFENNEEEDSIFPNLDKNMKLSVNELLRHNYIQTNSVMYRRQKYDLMPSDILPLDWYLHLYHAQFGKIGFIKDTMSVYRKHSGGIWWESGRNIDTIWKKYGLPHLGLYLEVQKIYGKNKQYREIIHGHIGKLLSTLIVVDKKYTDNLIERALLKYPSAFEPYLINQYTTIEKQDSEIKRLGNIIEKKESALQQKNQEIGWMINSRFWKMRNVIARVRRK